MVTDQGNPRAIEPTAGEPHQLNENCWCTRCDRFDPAGACPGKPAAKEEQRTDGIFSERTGNERDLFVAWYESLSPEERVDVWYECTCMTREEVEAQLARLPAYDSFVKDCGKQIFHLLLDASSDARKAGQLGQALPFASTLTRWQEFRSYLDRNPPVKFSFVTEPPQPTSASPAKLGGPVDAFREELVEALRKASADADARAPGDWLHALADRLENGPAR